MKVSDQKIRELVNSAVATASSYNNSASLKTILSLLDLTTLNTTDTQTKIVSLCNKVNSFSNHFPDLPNVAAICVYPAFIETARKNLAVNNVKIASVAGGFPSSQTFLAVKLAEVSQALESGAEEIDIVMSLGVFLDNNFSSVLNELKEVKRLVKKNHLKVILETGALSSYNDVYLASMLAMEAGADFIKTSTGKQKPAASLEAVAIMCSAIHDFYLSSGKKVGIKPAGGISTVVDALPYLSLVAAVLGEDWLNPGLFRFGASRLANDLISKLIEFEKGEKEEITYF